MEAELSRVSTENNEWLLDKAGTGIGAGQHSDACFAKTCVGGTTYGYGIDQAKAVYEAFQKLPKIAASPAAAATDTAAEERVAEQAAEEQATADQVAAETAAEE